MSPIDNYISLEYEMSSPLMCVNRVAYFDEPPDLDGTAAKTIAIYSSDFALPTPKRRTKVRAKCAGTHQAAAGSFSDIDHSATSPARRTRAIQASFDDPSNSDTDPYLLIGFDTEFKTPPPVTRGQIAAGMARSQILSYQFHALNDKGDEWDGICCTDDGRRMTLGEFLVVALGVGARAKGYRDLPTRIYLVGHFTRADIPAFLDFRNMQQFLSNLRGTFSSIDRAIELEIKDPSTDHPIKISVLLRDTMLLTPNAAKSLKELGTLVGQPKVTLDADPALAKYKIANMDIVRRTEWPLYRRYAINDATICVRYMAKLIELYRSITQKSKVPVTLSSIGVELLMKGWATQQLEYLNLLGKEVVSDSSYSETRRHYVPSKRVEHIQEVHDCVEFVTNCYHGGRNEQFYFGPSDVDDWTDYDLSSAYPTAMSLIGLPQWKEIDFGTNIADFTPSTLGFARVHFEFPSSVRYPTLPVRTANGLVFPRTGTSMCAAPELIVARELGAKIEVVRSLLVPTVETDQIFASFIRDCLKRRNAAGKGTLDAAFWKEISNSTYGKTAQGLRLKRAYDMRDRKVGKLPESRITNAFFAAFITSFVRGTMGEIINNLPRSATVFSCTTDGFLCNASDQAVSQSQQGKLATLYRQARLTLTGAPAVLEVKHAVKQLVGWRTRGQATLQAGDGNKMPTDQTIVLAKGGIRTPPHCDTVASQNEEIVRMFFDRQPNDMITVDSLTGVRDIVERDADLVAKTFDKRLNMEFDWKRRPISVSSCNTHNHVRIDTSAWNSVSDFKKIRDGWQLYTKKTSRCVKSLSDYDLFADYMETQAFQTAHGGQWMRTDARGLGRLRQLLCSAWAEGKAGLDRTASNMTAKEFAKQLEECGIPCTKAGVENAIRRGFKAFDCPDTQLVREALQKLRYRFSTLDVDSFVDAKVTSDWASIQRTKLHELLPRVISLAEGPLAPHTNMS